MMFDDLNEKEFVTTAEMIELLRISRPTLYKLLKKDDLFPKPIYLSSRKRVFRMEQVKQWIIQKENLG